MTPRLPIILSLITLAIVVGVAGCGGLHRYDGRLVAADSLMQTDPDSALALVSAVSPDSLATEGDRAYRDLLMTQARYKAYQDILASDDSAITRAMAWYRAHSGEREKLTRAYLYKGAMMQELGHVDSAMYYYKTAEITADPKDYANLGQINTRIAALYNDYYADSQICYDKNKQALQYYKLTGNKPLQLVCMLNMAGCSGIMHRDGAEQLLNQATELAIELNDSSNYYLCQELLCRQFSYRGKSVAKAKQIAMHCLNDYRDYIDHDLLLDLADIYAYSGMPDSARYYLNLVTANAIMTNPEQVLTRKYFILSRITRLEGDTALSKHYDMLAHQVSDSILDNEKRYQIQQIENEYNFEQTKNHVQTIHDLRWVIIAISLIAALLIISLITAYVRRMYRTKAILKELEAAMAELERQRTDAEGASKYVGNRIAAINELYNAIRVRKSDDGGRKKSVIPLPGLLKELDDKKELLQMELSDTFWPKLRMSVDGEYNGIVSFVESRYPNLSESDIRLFCLLCADISPQIIKLCMNYSSAKTSSSYRNRLVQKKMGLDMTFDEFVEQYMQGHLNKQ